MAKDVILVKGRVTRKAFCRNGDAIFSLNTDESRDDEGKYTKSHVILCWDVNLTEAVKRSVSVDCLVQIEGTVNEYREQFRNPDAPISVEADNIKIWDGKKWLELEIEKKLYFRRIDGAGRIKCLNCNYQEEIVSLIHGVNIINNTTKGVQCQSCGQFHSMWHQPIQCECGGASSRDEPLFCPECKSDNLHYKCKLII